PRTLKPALQFPTRGIGQAKWAPAHIASQFRRRPPLSLHIGEIDATSLVAGERTLDASRTQPQLCLRTMRIESASCPVNYAMDGSRKAGHHVRVQSLLDDFPGPDRDDDLLDRQSM